MDAYLTDWIEWSYRVREEQRRDAPPFVAQLAALKEEREAYRSAGPPRNLPSPRLPVPNPPIP
jgi:hypothetical protein